MKIQEAIENLKYLISGDCTDNQMDFVEEIEMAINALEKQMPKKPNLKSVTDYEGNITDGVFICSVCGRTICYEIEGNFKENYPYCSCGHSLDWSDHPTEKGGEG